MLGWYIFVVNETWNKEVKISQISQMDNYLEQFRECA